MNKRVLVLLFSATVLFSCMTTGDESKRSHFSVAIIGGGPAGYTAAIYASRANYTSAIFVGGESAIEGTEMIENWPGEQKISGFDLMKKIGDHAVSLGAVLKNEKVEQVDLSSRPYKIITKSKSYTSDAVIITTGTSRKKLNVPGEDEFWGRGVSACATCDGPFYKDKNVVVMGGGRTALTEAMHLSRLVKHVTVIHSSPELHVADRVMNSVLEAKNVSVIGSSRAVEIKGTNGVVSSIVINKSGSLQEIPTDAVFVAIGVIPNTQIFKGFLELDEVGYIKSFGGSKTSKEGVFWAGDVGHSKYQQAIVAAGEGCIAALDAADFLGEHK